MVSVGIRELKNRLSQYLKRVRAGERLVVTERGKPRGARRPPRIKGPSVAQAVIEDRR